MAELNSNSGEKMEESGNASSIAETALPPNTGLPTADDDSGRPISEPIPIKNEDDVSLVGTRPTQSGKKTRARGRKNAGANSATNEITPPSRQVPFSIEAEKGVLGCIMLQPRENLSLFTSKLKGKDNFENVFYDVRHQTLITQMVEMYDSGQVIDDLTLTQKLSDKGLIDAAGGIAYVSSLKDIPPSPLNMSYYLDIVRAKYLLRSLIQTCTELAEDVYSKPDDVEGLLDRAEKEVLRINGEWAQGSSLNMKDLVQNAFQIVENYFKRKGSLTGLGTGFPQLDKLTSGLHGGEMIVIAARPSMGKTSLAMNIAEHIAIELGEPVGVFSLEMTAESLVMRMLCSRTRVSMQAIRTGALTMQDLSHMTGEAGKLAAAPIYIDDTPGLSILNLRSRARRMMEKGIKLFVIDYMQLLTSPGSRGNNNSNRQQEIADISNGVKSLAKELNVPIIVLSQLNRDVEKEKNRQPRLSDLRESGAIEQDADLVLLIYRPEIRSSENKYAKNDDEEPIAEEVAAESCVEVKIIIAKQRNGPTGIVDLIFLKNYTRFENVERVRQEDVRES